MSYTDGTPSTENHSCCFFYFSEDGSKVQILHSAVFRCPGISFFGAFNYFLPYVSEALCGVEEICGHLVCDGEKFSYRSQKSFFLKMTPR